MASKPPPVERFHQNIVSLTELLQELVADVYSKGYKIVNPSLIGIAGAIINGTDKNTVIQNFVEYSFPHWEEIRQCNEDFFIEHAKNVFRDLPVNHVDAFKTLFTLKDSKGNHILPEEDRQSIWEYFHSLIKISIKYIHQQRKTNKSYMKEMDFEDTIEKWGITMLD